MTDYGIKVSEDGFDVGTAADKNLSLKSGFTLLKVFSQGQTTLGSTGWNGVAHNLGYKPQFLTYVNTAAGNAYIGQAVFNFNGFTAPTAISRVDNSYVYTYNTGGSEKVYTYIFYEQIGTGGTVSNNPTDNYGIKVSKDGVGVGTANILDQTFNSEKNSLKIAFDGTFTGTPSAGNGYVVNGTIPHGFNFIPTYLVFYQVGTGSPWIFQETLEDLSGKGVFVDSFSDGTNLNIQITSNNIQGTVNVRYLIMADAGTQ